MTAQNNIDALAQWIRSILAEGLPLTESVLDYMTVTFGTTDLAAIIDEDATGEVDSLLELIFFPDIDLQVRYESQWGADSFSDKDLDEIRTLVGQSPPATTIIPPTGGPGISIELPLFALDAFVQRLNITWQPAPQLASTLATRWPRSDGIRMRVQLRNARLDWHTDQVQLVDRFLTKMPTNETERETCLTFLLSILSELAPDKAPFDFLIAKKFFYFQSLCKAEEFERKRHTSNMEIMMLQGNRSAHGSVAQWRQQMQWIDRICHALFGRTHFFQQPDEQCMDLHSNGEHQMMQDIIRTLS